MATVNPVCTYSSKGTCKVVWTGIVTGDTVVAINGLAAYNADRSVQVEGTFNGGTTVKLLGANDGSNYRQLTREADGAPISLLAAGIDTIAECVDSLKPSVTLGSADSITVTVFLTSTVG
jgi:hypothetical protein